VLEIARAAVRSAKIPQRRAAGLHRLDQHRAHPGRQVVEPARRRAALEHQLPRLDIGPDMGTVQRLAHIDVAQPGDHSLVEQRRLDRRLLALEALSHLLGIEIVAQRLRAEPGEIGTLRLVTEEIDEAKAPRIIVDQPQLPVLGMGEVEQQMVVLFLLRRLVVARRLLELEVDEAIAAGHAQMAEQGLAVRQPEQQVFRPPPDAFDGLPDERLRQRVGEGKPQILSIERHRLDTSSLDVGCETAAHGFNLGQFRHQGLLARAPDVAGLLPRRKPRRESGGAAP
jgi:hypothetical protein